MPKPNAPHNHGERFDRLLQNIADAVGNDDELAALHEITEALWQLLTPEQEDEFFEQIAPLEAKAGQWAGAIDDDNLGPHGTGNVCLMPNGLDSNGRQLPPLTPPAEVGAQLAGLAALHRKYADGASVKAAALVAVLQSAVRRQAQDDDFGVVLWSVGNPDFGQLHGPGEGSPTMLVCAPSLRDIQQVVAAYIGCYELSGGNCPLFPVFRRQVQVADVSYNRRLWTPGKSSREIDPETGRAT